LFHVIATGATASAAQDSILSHNRLPTTGENFVTLGAASAGRKTRFSPQGSAPLH
jgi:hypothetical protein